MLRAVRKVTCMRVSTELRHSAFRVSSSDRARESARCTVTVVDSSAMSRSVAVWRSIAGARALLRTTLYYGDAISVREALWLGTPVIATDNGMRPEGVCLIPPGDPEGLLRAIGQCLGEGPGRGEGPGAPGEANEENLRAVLRLYQEMLG